MEEFIEEEQDEDWSLPIENECSISAVSPSHERAKVYRSGNQHHQNVPDYKNSKLGHSRTIIQIDIDCFYAQVEMLRNPELRNKPLGIQQKYLLVTCNYVAREHGVTKLMGIKEAKEKCPNLVMVSGEDLTHYREMSYKISEFLQKYTPYIERLGFDENFLDVSELVHQRLQNRDTNGKVIGHTYKNSEKEIEITPTCSCGCHTRLVIGSEIASDIRESLREELGITCCAGISYNKLLAKLVAGKHKPNQQTTLFPEQTDGFMSSLSKANDIPGVGHTMSKKLSSLGVNSISDLQEVLVSDLIDELGETSAVHIKQLSYGVDDTPVVPFKRPQTLSDEDSFKKCSTEKEVRSKVKQLITSLMIRIKDDGRTPHTLRLTIRRFTTTNKYTSRESRQCPLPPHIFSVISDNTDQTIAKIEEKAVSLFHKLVNVNQPFHLTLINVAFCNLQDKAKNSISTFFSPKKQTTPALNCLTGSDVEVERIEEEEGNSENAVDRESLKTKNSPGGALCGLQKWLKQPRTKVVTISDQLNCSDFEQSCQNTPGSVRLTKLNENCDGYFYHKGIKRKNEICSEVSMKKRRSLDEFFNVKEKKMGGVLPTTNKSGVLPPNVDKEVFSQLPTDVQQEIINDHKQNLGIRLEERQSPVDIYDVSAGQSSSDRFKSEKDELCNNIELSSNNNQVEPSSKDQSFLEHHENSVKNVEIETDQGNCIYSQEDRKSLLDNPGGSNSHQVEQSGECVLPSSCGERNISVIMSDKKDITDITENDAMFLEQKNNFKFDSVESDIYCKMGDSSSESVYVDKTNLPADIDPEVFVNLPVDIQKELLEQYKSNHENSERPKTKQSSGSKNKQVSPQNSSILNFFGKAGNLK